MKKRERTKSNDIFSVWKCKSFLLLLLVGVCFTLTASIITNYFRDKEPDVNEALEEYLSSSFASNINNLYIYDIDKPMEDFMDSSAVTSFFFCSSSYPAADELLDYLCNNLTAMAERADYITAAAVYASASNTFVTSHTDKITDSQLNDLLKDLVYNYNSNSVDKNSLSGESYNTFLFKYEDYVVFSKDLTTLSGASYSSMFLLMDADAFSSFVYRANGMIPYKVSIYDSHNTLLFSNSDRSEKEKKEAAAKAAKEHKKYGFISVSVGEGLSTLFKELNVDYIIEGGQTMNPSTEDMLNAIAEVNADTIYIFPNNKNIVLAANQARDLTEDKEIVVVPTKTIPQGITALISFQPEMNGEENLEAMMEAVSMVKTGQVTYAVRDTRLDEKEIHEGDIMGIGDHGILAVGKGRENVAKEMVAAMVDADSEVISIYYGAETTEEDAESLAAELEEAYPDCEVEVNMGGQPIYYYIISVE